MAYNDTAYEEDLDMDWPNDSSWVDPTLMEKYLANKSIDEPAYTTLIVIYCMLIVMGALGNILVVCTVQFIFFL